MPAKAFALLGVFIAIAIVAGLIAWRVVVPASRWGWALPILLAFLALYTSGHLLGLAAGPIIQLFGFDVAIVLDVLLALVAAFVGAGVHLVLTRALAPA
jgi:hypothetical protein